jgi:hypothetical protein
LYNDRFLLLPFGQQAQLRKFEVEEDVEENKSAVTVAANRSFIGQFQFA